MRKTIIIEGMSCGNCVKHVTKALNEVDGIEIIEVEIGKAVIEGDASDAVLTEAIEDFGFDVKSIG
ncbi:heavy-metal-associated domain-containing protein [Clostridium sp.]|uniref:heavy-metal-associated domain-containing protein n=1 Tax=Clostridium sp. TaxID=1506 RepID=UPI003995481B